MKNFLILAFFSFTAVGVVAQISMNMNMLCVWDDENLPTRSGGAYSDIWGYSDGAGNEVAILGGIEDIFFIDVSNCSLIDSFHILNTGTTNTNPSIWRDFKTYGQYAYAVADEGSSGLIIFDLSDIPNNVTKVLQTNAFFNKTHNIFIDEPNGRLYVAGSDTRSNGLIVLDINGANAANPVLIDDPVLPGGYVHDVFVKDNLAWASHGSGGLRVYNFSNFSGSNDPVQMGVYDGYQEEGYNHSSWLDDSNTYLVFADETFGRSMKRVEVDIDLTNNVVTFSNLELFKSHLSGGTNANSIPHNPFILGDNVYISYYHDGLQVYDISQPDTVIKKAYYDTWPLNTGYSGYDGAWGAYPYLPSGKIIVSDINNGMFSIEMFDNPLPLKFIDFQVNQIEDDIQVKWSVEGYEDDASFELNYSSDGGNSFQSINNQAYNHNQDQFSFKHVNPGKNKIHYYQVNVVNQDGSRTASVVKSKWIRGGEEMALKSNQIIDQLELINGPEDLMARVEIFTTSGQMVQSEELLLTGNQSFIKIGYLPSQMYILNVTAGDFNFTEKFWIGQ